MDFEINSRIKILSTLSIINKKYIDTQGNSGFNIISLYEQQSFILKFNLKLRIYRSYSTKKIVVMHSNLETYKLDPNWVTGFTDAEGSFSISILENKNFKKGWEIQPRFTLTLHERDKALLVKIKKFFNMGNIHRNRSNALQFKVSSVKDLEFLVKHFKQYPLKSSKEADFKLCLMVLELMIRKEHLTHEGFLKIIAIKASMNLGLSESLTKAFPDVVPVRRPLVKNPQEESIDPNWLAGFTDGEGCFMINITASKTKVGLRVTLVFLLTQHTRDEKLIRCLVKFLNCGNVYKNREAFNFNVSKFIDIYEKIIPFFKKYPLQGVKALDFDDWCKAAEIIKKKEHLTPEGLERIRKIKAGMNLGRKLNTLY